MKKTYYPTIKETLYHEKMSNGLNVYLMPKDGFTKTYGLFSTRFGSIDRSFVPLGETDLITVPDGVAHFLEHKMFDMEDGDASEKFAALGASSNAFTSHSRTAYLFNTATNVDECTELLLDFVQELNVTPESIEKEKGIINQEIGMYNDDPDWRGYFGAISNLYHNHPVRIDIAGTVETVAEIDYDILQKCYHTFYHPSNMMLFVSGNFDPEHLMSIVRDNQAKKDFNDMPPIVRGDHNEPETIFKAYEENEMDVTMTKVNVAIKVNNVPESPEEKLKRQLSFYIFMDMLFSKSSDSPKPEELLSYIHKLIEDIPHMTLDEEAFNRMKRNNIGTLIGFFNSVETIASLFSQYYLEGINLFDLFEAYQALTIDDIKNILPLFCKDLTSNFIVRPLKDNA